MTIIKYTSLAAAAALAAVTLSGCVAAPASDYRYDRGSDREWSRHHDRHHDRDGWRYDEDRDSRDARARGQQ